MRVIQGAFSILDGGGYDHGYNTTMITFGLTGGIASGKSTVTRTIRAHGIPIVDADVVAREVVEVGKPAWGFIRSMFGHEYLNEDETLNRTKLAALVFSNEQAMYNMNAIMGPLISGESDYQINQLHKAGHEIVGYDAALICEMGNADKYRPLIVVACKQETQLARLMKRNCLTEAEAMSRIEAQMPTDKKIAMADWVIYTDGTVEQSISETEFFIGQLKVKV